MGGVWRGGSLLTCMERVFDRMDGHTHKFSSSPYSHRSAIDRPRVVATSINSISNDTSVLSAVDVSSCGSISIFDVHARMFIVCNT